MAEDQVKQDANQTLSDGLSSMAEAALAVGAGAAVLYRAGGNVLFSDDLNRIYRFKNALAFDINKTGNLRADLDVWKQRFIDARDLWNNTAVQTSDDFKFGEKSSSIFDLLERRYEFEQNDEIKRSIGHELYKNDILNSLFTNEQFKNLPTDLKDQLHDLLEHAYNFRNQPARLQELRNSMTGELLKHKDLANKLLDQLQERINETPFSKTDIGYHTGEGQLWGDLDSNKLRINEAIKNRMALLNDPEIYLEELQKNSKVRKAIHMATGDRAVTLRDMLEDKGIRDLFRKNRLVTDKNNMPVLALDYLEETINSWKSEYASDPDKLKIIDQILDSEFSQEFRITESKDKDGKTIKKIRSFRGLDKLVDTVAEEYRNTLAGHLSKASEIININRQPETFVWHKGDFVPGLELAVSGKDEERLSADVIKIGSRFYKQEVTKDKDGIEHTSLKYLELSPYLRVHSNETGSFKRTIFSMYDKEGHKIVMDARDTGFMHDVLGLDLNIEMPLTLSNEESEALGNNINYFRHINIDIANKLASDNISTTELFDQVARLNRFNGFIERNTRSMTNGELRNFRTVLRDALSKDELSQDIYRNFIDITQKKDVSEIVDDLSTNLGINPDKYLSSDLRNDLQTYKRRPKYFMTQYMRQHKDLGSFSASNTIRETDLARDIFKRDIQQEIFMRIFSDYSSKHGPENAYRYARQLIERMRESADMTDESIVEIRRLMMQSFITWNTGLSKDTIKIKSPAQMKSVVENVYNLMGGNDEQFHKDFDSFAEQRSVGSGEEYVEHDASWKPRIDTPKYGVHFANPSAGELKDILNDINLSTKEKAAKTAKTVFGMFIGGKGHSRQITPLTMLGPYNLVNRLMDPLASGALSTILGTKISLPRGLDVTFDLSLHNGRGNFIQISKNLMLKRILPIYVGMQFLDATNDMQRQLTGMSTETSIRSGAANIDLGIRKALDATGLTGVLKNLKDSNVIWQYLDGSGSSFNSYKEQLDYYRNGYDPIRKGRFWAFGSANEFRGGQIEYWRPNALREATADAYDASLYGSLSNKWSHSLIPTPFSPLSPIRAIMDPYWLERMHYKDRPYPFTAPMFTEGTPWGAVLNATVGQIIKPVRMMHRNELTGGIDTSVMLDTINSYIKQKAKDRDNGELFVLQNGRIKAKAFMAYNAPTPTTRILSATYNNGQLVNLNGQPYDSYRGGIDISDYEKRVNYDASQDFYTTNPPDKPTTFAADVPGDTKHIHQERFKDLSFTEKMAIRAGNRDNTFSNVIYNALNDMNVGQKQKAALAPSDKITLDASQGVFIPEKMQYEQSDFQKEIDKESEIEDALHSQQGMGFVHSAAVSLRMVSGIYGWLGSLAGDYGEMNRPHIANASDMDSFSRRFWDNAYGGIGGDAMEILRRFIPTYGRYTAINPLKNTMPDWLPERFRMGDPFCISEDTLVETGDLSFNIAKNIKEDDTLISHKGKFRNVEVINIRKVKLDEKVYNIKVTSLTAVNSKFSENHPILTIKKKDLEAKKTTPVYDDKVFKTYIRANIILKALANGITNKKYLASLVGLDMNNVYTVFKCLYEHGSIEDYRDRKKCFHDIILKKYNPFDIDMLRRKLQWVKIKDLAVGDYVAYPLPEYHEQNSVIIDLADYLDYHCSEKYVYISKSIKTDEFIEIYEFIENNDLQNKKYKYNELKTMLTAHNWNRKTFMSVQSALLSKKGIERVNRYIELTPELSYAIGLYLAEGYDGNSRISFCLHEKEYNLFKRAYNGIAKQIKPTSYTWQHSSYGHGSEGYIFSRPIAKFFRSLIGKYCYNKMIPEIFWNAPKECVLRLIEGYFDGDGSYFITNTTNRISNKPQAYVSATSVNKIMLLQIRKLLLRFNIVMSIIVHNKESVFDWGKYNSTQGNYKSNTRESYMLKCIGTQAIKLIKLLWNKDINIQYERTGCQTFISDGYVYMRINSIEEVHGITEVYGFQVGIDKSFCTAGVATHNTSVPNGEERLPGVGYERLHRLHPDMYGNYGSLDRYAILSDIAPYSAEAKFWKQIAAKTAAQSEEGKAEFKAIRDRAKAANQHHSFYNYQFLHRGLDTQTVTIGEVLGRGKFKIAGSDDVYTLAGITVQDNQQIGTDKVMMQYLQPGAEVTIKTDSNENYKRMKDTTNSISAAVYVNGENVSTQMVENGDARYKKSDTSAAATLGKYGDVTAAIGKAAEFVAHLDIPWIHSQFLKVETPLESYQHDHIYGTQYQTWSEFWNTYIKPGFMQGWGDYGLFTAGQAARLAHEWVLNNRAENKKLLRLTDFAYTFTDRGAFVGNMIGFTAKLGGSGASTFRRRARNIGGNLSLLGSLAVSYQFENPLYMAVSYGSFGYQVAKQINKFTPFKKRWGVAASLLAGTVFWATASSGGLRNDRGVWIPDKTREKWMMNDYFDRLTYIKMMGLYHKAAAMAKSKEDVDVERLFNIEERDRIKKVQLKAQLLKEKQEIAAHPSKAAQDALTVINKKIQALSSTKTVLRGGEYTKSAILYKQAADATMYGLKSDASMTDILRALPAEDRDYFMEFVQERDPDKRAEILQYSSPQLKRALRQMWGLDWRKPISNEKFFQKFKLPGPLWKGWSPKVNLSDVKTKVVKNEGMLFSDFGIYESAYRKPNVINAPNIRNYRSNNSSSLTIKAKLEANLHGLGLSGAEVSVEPKPSGGIQMAANILNAVPQNLQNAVENILSGD